ncbi:penicillin-binding protein 1B [Colwellia psychrerythraea]|uniref:Penicillin-binding protein 1B n=1 Tax=Colwellia psychrerythraea TaxID=28229 RepID=A0A099KIQ8_COLPS|nr:penicillin-binding protein 1B [Colwellia psychrerythraea]KGJ90689.1 penicillin-binding protein 1B [Colwellia psychrerythraea]
MSKNKTQKQSAPADKKKSLSSRIGLTLGKLMIATIFALGIFSIYLDAKVRKTFEGQRWHIPVQVYGQLRTLQPGERVDLNEIAQSLIINGYKKVNYVTRVGEFSHSAERLIIFQRAFDFVDSANHAQQLSIDVVNDIVVTLSVDEQPVARVTLEPKLLARLVPDNKEDRVLVSLEEVPSQLIDTLLLIEDRDYYHHHGISPLGIFRALFNNIRAGRTVQGGSTLTQQLAKNMFLSRERTLSRKIKEALMALILELRYSKDQLLEAYINEVYLGQNYANGVYGFGLAAQFYFGKSINEISHAQMALLIAQVKGPSYYDPWRHPKRAKERRDLVLRLMFEQHLLSLVDFELAAESELSVRSHRRLAKKNYPAYLQLVNAELNRHLSSFTQKSGIKVFTGFSHRSQQLLEQSVAQQLPLLERQYKQSDLEVAMIVTDIASGEVRALVGGRESGYAGFNRAINAKRHIGSLIKPIIYATALQRYQQYNLATPLDDKAITLQSGSGKKWQPKNYDGKYRGQVSLIEGLVYSLNIPTINLGMSLGLDSVADTIKALGYMHKLQMRPSVLLGAINMSPLDVNQLYLPIAGKGYSQKSHTITKILSPKNETLWQNNLISEQRLSGNTAYLVDYALAQVTKVGTARSLTWRLNNKQVAGKTGTSNSSRDSWFIGYDDKHLITTWLGKDDNTSTGLTGSSGALPLFASFMKKQGVVNKIEEKPAGIVVTLFEQQTGNAVTDACANTVIYPAIRKGIFTTKQCLQAKEDKRSWFEKIFGE